MIENDNMNPLWNKVFKKELVDWDVDYSLYINVTNGTDRFQLLPIVFNATTMFYCNELFYYYRVDNNNNSIIHRFKDTIFYSLKQNNIRMRTLLKKNDLWNE